MRTFIKSRCERKAITCTKKFEQHVQLIIKDKFTVDRLRESRISECSLNSFHIRSHFVTLINKKAPENTGAFNNLLTISYLSIAKAIDK